MKEQNKVVAWGILGGSLVLWLLLRGQHPMVTPVLIGVTLVVLARELNLVRALRIPLYAGVALVAGNLLLEGLDDGLRIAISVLGIALVLLASYLGRRAGGDADSTGESADS